MAKKKKGGKTHHKGSTAQATPSTARHTRFDLRRPGTTVEALLHPQSVDEGVWKYLPLVLALAFVARAAVALSGDFMLHPDEIMQYLEPAHRLVFGNGIVPWEYFYGARSWLVPGMIAGVLKLFDVTGFGQPFWYVSGVKLALCAISLTIPAGMYFFARRHFSEAAARAALLAGAFWYELVVFAHKPMTEFVATATLLALLALCIHPAVNGTRTVWLAALLAVLAPAVRLQYAPLALVLLGLFFLRTEKKRQLTLVAATFFLAIGIFDMVTWNLAAGSFGEAAWDHSLFHSYRTNIDVNLALGTLIPTTHPAWQYLAWLMYAGAGLTLACMVVGLCEPRRYGLMLALIMLIVLIHAAQTHKEYRFIFVVIPLWLLLGADLVVRFTAGANLRRLRVAAVAVVFTIVSSAGILEALPYQNRSYQGVYTRAPEKLGFIGRQDPIFAVYRYLTRTPGVIAVADTLNAYFSTPGYYYLHHKVPFYDRDTLNMAKKDLPTFSATITHVISAGPDVVLPGYSVEKEFGPIRIWRREENDAPVRRWRSYAPIIDSGYGQLLRQLHPDAPAIPPNWGIEFVDEGGQAPGS